MAYAIGDRVRLRNTSCTGVITGYSQYIRGRGYYSISNPEENNGDFPLAYDVEYDAPIWHGDFMRGYKRTIHRGIHIEDVLELLGG